MLFLDKLVWPAELTMFVKNRFGIKSYLYDGLQTFRTILGRNPDKNRNPYTNKVPIENPLYFYRAQPCTDITSFLSGPYFYRGFDFCPGSCPKWSWLFWNRHMKSGKAVATVVAHVLVHIWEWKIIGIWFFVIGLNYPSPPQRSLQKVPPAL